MKDVAVTFKLNQTPTTSEPNQAGGGCYALRRLKPWEHAGKVAHPTSDRKAEYEKGKRKRTLVQTA